QFAAWASVGAALVTAVLGCVNYFIGSSFWFYAPSLRFVIGSSSKSNEFFMPGWSWAAAAYWLAFPLATAAGRLLSAIAGFVRKAFPKCDLRPFFLVQTVVCAAILLAWHLRGGLGLEQSYYTSYDLPSAFLALGCMLVFPWEHWRASTYWLFV